MTAARSTSSGLGLAMAGLLLLSAGSASAQEGREASKQVAAATEPERAPRSRRLQLVARATVDVDSWRARLADVDIDARELAFDELVARAADDLKLRLAVQSWSMDPGEPELAWAARMALRELERIAQPQRARWVRTDTGQLHRLLDEELAQERVGRERRPSLDPAQELRSFSSFGEVLPFEDRQVTGLHAPRQFQLPRNARVTRRYHLDIQPEGVTLYESVLERGVWNRRTYAAESLEALLESAPELRHQVPGLASFIARPFAPGSEFGWTSGVPGFRTDPQLLVQGQPVTPRPPGRVRQGARSTFVLGVKCTPVTGDEAAGRLLGPGVGLLIESRQPGSVAEELGLQRGDILIELGGQPLCSLDEITRALRERSEVEIEVKLIDRQGIERKRVWSPRAPQQDE